MAEGDGTFYKAIILLGVTFGVGFYTGYKVIFRLIALCGWENEVLFSSRQKS